MGAYVYRLGKKATVFDLVMGGSAMGCGTLNYGYKPWLDCDSENSKLNGRARAWVQSSWKNEDRPKFVITADKPALGVAVIHWRKNQSLINDSSSQYGSESRTVGYLIKNEHDEWTLGTMQEVKVQCATSGHRLMSGLKVSGCGEWYHATGCYLCGVLTVGDSVKEAAKREADRKAEELKKKHQMMQKVMCDA